MGEGEEVWGGVGGGAALKCVARVRLLEGRGKVVCVWGGGVGGKGRRFRPEWEEEWR